jgi:hypothetical protein
VTEIAIDRLARDCLEPFKLHTLLSERCNANFVTSFKRLVFAFVVHDWLLVSG